MRSSVRKFTVPMCAALALASLLTVSACSSDSGSGDAVCAFDELLPPNQVLLGSWCVVAVELATNQLPQPGLCTAVYDRLPAAGSDTSQWTIAVNGNNVTATVGTSGTLEGRASGLEMNLAGSLTNDNPGGVFDVGCAALITTVPASSSSPSFVGAAAYQFSANDGTVCTGVLNVSATKGPC